MPPPQPPAARRPARLRVSHLLILLLALATGLALVPVQWGRTAEHELLMTVWGMPMEDALFRDGYARGFERLHPDVRVQYQRMVDLVTKYQAWHVVGRGADVMRISIADYHTLIDAGILEPLNHFIHDLTLGLTPEQVADFFPDIWQSLHVDGEIYALPSDNSQYGLYYNKTIFDQYDATHPDAPLGYPHVGWTWADLRRAAQALTVYGRDGQIEQHGIAFDLWAWPFLAFLYQAGGQVWDNAETTTLINSEEGVEALEYLVSLIPKNAPVRSLELAKTASGPDTLFKLGKVAMLLEGCWRVPDVELHNPDLDFAVAPLPRGRRRAVPTGSVLWGISVHSRHKEQAWQMVKWLVSTEQSLLYWDTLRVAPAAQFSVINSPDFSQTRGVVRQIRGKERIVVPPMPAERFDERAAWLRDAITPDPQTGETPAFMVVAKYERDLEWRLAAALVQAVRGERTPREALDAAARDIHATIDRDRKARGLPPVERR